MIAKNEVFERSELLLGEANIAQLQKLKVAVIGLGGVGSFVAEALARSGIGHLFIIDNDIYQASNLNRQLGASLDSIGLSKVKVTTDRIHAIAPFCTVTSKECFLMPDSDFSCLLGCDYIADCIDTVSSKIALAVYCEANNLKLISAMGTARKFKPELVTITDLYQTKYDKLCKVMRHELKKRNVHKLTVCYSEEPLQALSAKQIEERQLKSADNQIKKIPLASLIFVPATAGLRIAYKIVSDLIKD